mmetsp:Transcript_4188/g.9059  ORF Transcript_4188/g.9059 Transcript_4188/m.9059 type:complete len:252 (+) Transcript_4188:519-1274(+)
MQMAASLAWNVSPPLLPHIISSKSSWCSQTTSWPLSWWRPARPPLTRPPRRRLPWPSRCSGATPTRRRKCGSASSRSCPRSSVPRHRRMRRCTTSSPGASSDFRLRRTRLSAPMCSRPLTRPSTSLQSLKTERMTTTARTAPRSRARRTGRSLSPPTCTSLRRSAVMQTYSYIAVWPSSSPPLATRSCPLRRLAASSPRRSVTATSSQGSRKLSSHATRRSAMRRMHRSMQRSLPSPSTSTAAEAWTSRMP